MPTDKPQCCAMVLDATHWQDRQCTNSAKVERYGRYYCSIHDPIRVAERGAKAVAAHKAKMAAEKRRRVRHGLAEATAEDLAADPAVRALVADAVRREREAVVAWSRDFAESASEEGEHLVATMIAVNAAAIESGAHHPTETDR